MNTKLNSTTRTFKRQLTDWITSTYWKMFHPRIVSRFGIKFKIDPQVVPYYIIRRKTFRSLLPVFDHYVTSNSIVLDIGASFGFYSLYSLINVGFEMCVRLGYRSQANRKVVLTSFEN